MCVCVWVCVCVCVQARMDSTKSQLLPPYIRHQELSLFQLPYTIGLSYDIRLWTPCMFYISTTQGTPGSTSVCSYITNSRPFFMFLVFKFLPPSVPGCQNMIIIIMHIFQSLSGIALRVVLILHLRVCGVVICLHSPWGRDGRYWK